MIRQLLILLLVSVPIVAVELTYGKGTFGYQFGLKRVMDCDVKFDVNVLSLRESRLDIYKGLYLYGNIDIYNSDRLDDYASYVDRVADSGLSGFSPSSVGSSMGLPVPVSFEMRGVDVGIGLGYELFGDKRGDYIGVGIGSGFSMPYIETDNIIDNAKLFASILDKTETKIMTYKLMPSIQGRYQVIDMLSIEGNFAFGYQFGTLSNDYLDSDVDFSGTVFQSDVSLSLMPFKTGYAKHVVFSAGYRYGKWNVESMNVRLMDGSFASDFSSVLDLGFDSQFFYIGAGWRF